jgi:hypothetical protein
VPERVAEIVILAEDLDKINFVWHYLKRKGHHTRNIRAVSCPQGRGSGEQHVRERYPTEVRYYRSRSARRRASLVAVTDADTKTVAERYAELETSLTKAGEVGRQPAEAIACLIPKRHIETWIYCLLSGHVDEITDYKSRGDVQDKLKAAAQNFFDWSRPNYSLPVHCVESLKRGLAESQRIG